MPLWITNNTELVLGTFDFTFFLNVPSFHVNKRGKGTRKKSFLHIAIAMQIQNTIIYRAWYSYIISYFQNYQFYVNISLSDL